MDNVCNRCLFSIPSKVDMAEEQEYLRISNLWEGPAIHGLPITLRMLRVSLTNLIGILVPRGRAPFGQHEERRDI